MSLGCLLPEVNCAERSEFGDSPLVGDMGQKCRQREYHRTNILVLLATLWQKLLMFWPVLTGRG
jgi:hypothetical protein